MSILECKQYPLKPRCVPAEDRIFSLNNGKVRNLSFCRPLVPEGVIHASM